MEAGRYTLPPSKIHYLRWLPLSKWWRSTISHPPPPSVVAQGASPSLPYPVGGGLPLSPDCLSPSCGAPPETIDGAARPLEAEALDWRVGDPARGVDPVVGAARAPYNEQRRRCSTSTASRSGCKCSTDTDLVATTRPDADIVVADAGRWWCGWAQHRACMGLHWAHF